MNSIEENSKITTNFIKSIICKAKDRVFMIIRQTTKELLAASLQELAQSKSIDKITIREIAQNCQLTSLPFLYFYRYIGGRI